MSSSDAQAGRGLSHQPDCHINGCTTDCPPYVEPEPSRYWWCYECEGRTQTRRYRTDLLEEWIDLCDPCASKTAPAEAVR